MDKPYGPDPKIMEKILESSDFTLKISPAERVLENEDKDGSYKIFCRGIPSDFFEDRLIQLFIDDEDYDEITKFQLIMDPTTELNKGYALISYAQKSSAERVQKRLNNFEIVIGRRLEIDWYIPYDEDNIVDDPYSNEFSFMKNVHTCQESSLSSYCTCIEQKLDEVLTIWNMVQKAEEKANTKQIEIAKQKNEVQYACHSLLLEKINPTDEKITDILRASQYALNHINNISLDEILMVHEKIKPDIKEIGVFRDTDIFINGIYNIPSYPSDPEKIKSEIGIVIQLIHKAIKEKDRKKAIIMGITASIDFVLTHPFFDGNGRVSRLILGVILKKLGSPWVVIPTFDSTRYYEAFLKLRDADDYTLMYRYLTRCIMESMKAYLKNLDSGLE